MLGMGTLKVFTAGMPAKLNLRQLRRYMYCTAMVKSGMASVVCNFCSHIGMVSLVVLAAMLQAGRSLNMRISNMPNNSVTESKGCDSVQTSLI